MVKYFNSIRIIKYLNNILYRQNFDKQSQHLFKSIESIDLSKRVLSMILIRRPVSVIVGLCPFN